VSDGCATLYTNVGHQVKKYGIHGSSKHAAPIYNHEGWRCSITHVSALVGYKSYLTSASCNHSPIFALIYVFKSFHNNAPFTVNPVLVMTTLNVRSASYCYLPDELLLEVLVFFEKWEKVERQTTLARVAAVNR
jgi:hypothetical protein